MGCCSGKKNEVKKSRGKKQHSRKGPKGAAHVSKKGDKKPLPDPRGGKKKTSSHSRSKPPSGSKTPVQKGTSSKSKRDSKGGAPPAKSAPPLVLRRVDSDKRPNTKTPVSCSTTKSGSSKRDSSTSGKKLNPADLRLAKKRESHAKSLNTHVNSKEKDMPTSNVDTADSSTPPSKRKIKQQPAAKQPSPSVPPKKKAPLPAPPLPPSRDAKKKKEPEQSQSTSHSSSTGSKESVKPPAAVAAKTSPKALGVSRSKLPMQKLTISSHIEDGIVVSQWYYTELRELGMPPSSVADLLQGGPRQQLNLQQQQ